MKFVRIILSTLTSPFFWTGMGLGEILYVIFGAHDRNNGFCFLATYMLITTICLFRWIYTGQIK